MNKEKLLRWTKRLLGLIAMLFWLLMIYEVSHLSVPFMEQAPYCMGSTMLIFGLLTALYKGLDHWFIKEKF